MGGERGFDLFINAKFITEILMTKASDHNSICWFISTLCRSIAAGLVRYSRVVYF